MRMSQGSGPLGSCKATCVLVPPLLLTFTLAAGLTRGRGPPGAAPLGNLPVCALRGTGAADICVCVGTPSIPTCAHLIPNGVLPRAFLIPQALGTARFQSSGRPRDLQEQGRPHPGLFISPLLFI